MLTKSTIYVPSVPIVPVTFIRELQDIPWMIITVLLSNSSLNSAKMLRLGWKVALIDSLQFIAKLEKEELVSWFAASCYGVGDSRAVLKR
jgi:hypothetical protein